MCKSFSPETIAKRAVKAGRQSRNLRWRIDDAWSRGNNIYFDGLWFRIRDARHVLAEMVKAEERIAGVTHS